MLKMRSKGLLAGVVAAAIVCGCLPFTAGAAAAVKDVTVKSAQSPVTKLTVTVSPATTTEGGTLAFTINVESPTNLSGQKLFWQTFDGTAHGGSGPPSDYQFV